MQQPLEISFNDIEKTPELDALIHEKAGRLEKFCDNLVSCHVSVAKPHAHQETGSGYRVRVEARIPPNHQIVAHEHSSHGELHDNVETVIRRSFDAAERQVKEHVAKLREDERESFDDEDAPGIVTVIDKAKRYGIIKTVAGRDIYFADKAVLHDDFDRIEIGTSVRYEDQSGDEGPRASTVEIVEKKGEPMVKPG
ncbi:MAG TPA: HPF/RaiA family ribosome-associated protein [Opitutales bacterium]|nr:HPF/RaiA family ribosome-associated protein [Opitutales bacterium]